MTELKGKVALVTGASSGIGAAIVKTLLIEGMKVVGLARRVEKVRELGVGYEDQLFPLQGDVTNKEDLNRIFQWIQDNVGPLFVLVNNAGVVYNEYIDQCETDGIEKVLNTNLLGLILYSREAIRSMKANNVDGTIINICSVAGQYLIKFPRTSIYQASKFGATAFTENLRAELAGQKSKIRITVDEKKKRLGAYAIKNLPIAYMLNKPKSFQQVLSHYITFSKIDVTSKCMQLISVTTK